MYDLISIGDSVVDTFIPLIDAQVLIKDGEEKLAFPHGRKVPVGPALSIVGGNAANNAVGASRLKLKTAIYTNVGNLGDEEDDLRIIRKLRKEGVSTDYIVENNDLASDHHIVLTFKGERTILVYHQPWKYNLPDLDFSRWVYFTSLSPSFIHTSIISQLVNYLERTNAKLLFNPGTFQIKQGIKKNVRLLSLSEIFIVNVEEAELILEGNVKGKGESYIKKLLKGIADLGPRLVVITDGHKGSFGFDGEKYFHLDIFPAKLVDTTGAGDAYATGVLASLAHGNDLAQAMRWGSANGASVVEQVGSQAGLLTYHGMQEKLKENYKITTKEI
jgi:ribokinase